jgi:hypothetical protein
MRCMADTPQYRMADRLTGGKLATILIEARAEGKSLEQICRELYATHGVEVTRQTLAIWCDRVDKAQAAS